MKNHTGELRSWIVYHRKIADPNLKLYHKKHHNNNALKFECKAYSRQEALDKYFDYVGTDFYFFKVIRVSRQFEII